MLCWNNLGNSVKYMFEKTKIFEDNNGYLIQILNFLDVNVTLESNKEIGTGACYLPYDSGHPLS